jgi:tetratricopeptide (TPR) repeat protein
MATQRLTQGKEALARGDFKQALKELSVSISLNPSIDGYVQRAEANFNTGNIKAALLDLNRAEEIYAKNGDAEKDEADTWQQTIEQARNRYEGAASDSQGPPVRETISILVPTALEDLADVIVRISNRPELSTDGETMMSTEGTVVYDIEVFERNADWGRRDYVAQYFRTYQRAKLGHRPGHHRAGRSGNTNFVDAGTPHACSERTGGFNAQLQCRAHPRRSAGTVRGYLQR